MRWILSPSGLVWLLNVFFLIALHRQICFQPGTVIPAALKKVVEKLIGAAKTTKGGWRFEALKEVETPPVHAGAGWSEKIFDVKSGPVDLRVSQRKEPKSTWGQRDLIFIL